MQIPLQAEAPNDFIRRAADLLNNVDTHIYFDTSFLMWLVTLGHQSRGQFVSWAGSISAKIHVPVWTMHEFYRHHTAGTLKKRLGRHSEKLLKAARSFQREMQVYRDETSFVGSAATGYTHSVNELVDRLVSVTEAAKLWDYDSSASDVLTWMNQYSCATNTVFKQAEALAAYGTARYTQDIPPGFLDRRKQDKPKRGSNRYGDLLFWEEVVAHSEAEEASAVILFTCDRKADWFMDLGEVKDHAWKRLRDRWKPVPRPHPTLAVELKVRSKVEQLVFLDELYFGAVLWKTGRPMYERLAAVAINIDPSRFDEAEKTRRSVHERAQKRFKGSSIGVVQATRLIRAINSDPESTVIAILAKLEGNAPDVDAFVTGFTPAAIALLDVNQASLFAKNLHDRALVGPGPARSLVTAILDDLDKFSADQAAGLYAGFICSAYFENQIPRSVPVSPFLDDIFDWQSDIAFQKIIQAFDRYAVAARTPALYLPDGKQERHQIRIDHDSSQQQDPVVLQQIFYDERGLLVEGEIRRERTLVAMIGSNEATVEQLALLVCRHFGLPWSQIDIVRGDGDQMRLIPERVGFCDFDRFQPDLAPEAEMPLIELDDADVNLIVPDDNDEESFGHEEDD